jgi:hypothetical protein
VWRREELAEEEERWKLKEGLCQGWGRVNTAFVFTFEFIRDGGNHFAWKWSRRMNVAEIGMESKTLPFDKKLKRIHLMISVCKAYNHP